MNRRNLLIFSILVVGLQAADAQRRVRFPKAASSVPVSQPATVPTVPPLSQGGTAGSAVTVPPTTPPITTTQTAPIAPAAPGTIGGTTGSGLGTVGPPPSQLGIPQAQFDSYAFPPPGGSAVAPIPGAPAPSFMAPPNGFTTATPPVVSQAPPGAAAGFSAEGPPVLLPNGFEPIQWPATSIGQPTKFIQAVRFQHAYLHGDTKDNPSQVGINDSTVSVVTRWENFTGHPFFIMPSFALHLWDGPASPPTQDELPPQVYSAYLDGQWIYAPQPYHSVDLHIRLGVFTDFEGVTSDSFRILGGGTYNLRLTEKWAMKIGAEYVNRHRVKLLPAFGLLWTPNEYTRFDLFFPQPKASQKLASLGNMDVWWYIGGEYGGGVWSFQRANLTKDNVNLNDLRVFLGLEWGSDEQLRAGRRTVFFEAGYVWDREVMYVASPFTGFKPRDTFMLRAGVGY